MNQIETLSSHPRVTVRRTGAPLADGSCVVYWMQRAQRGRDNPALDVAVDAANILGKPVVVFFAPVPYYPHANLRHYIFLAQGIPDIAADLAERRIGFVLRRYPDHSLLSFCEELKPALVVGDENPMREPEGWRKTAARKLRLPLWTVDADVIVPSKLLEKAQYAAHIIRPRLNVLLPQFLVPARNPAAQIPWKQSPRLASLAPGTDITEGWQLDRSVPPVAEWRGGAHEAARLLKDFIAHKLTGYGTQRNKPETDHTSRLSPYLHFGHISPITLALAVQNADAPNPDKQAFLNQLTVWRELAVNLVRFNSDYDNFQCGEPWAHRTLAQHAADPRPVLYAQDQLERAETHDPLWNAAQMQMVRTGWMHNYVACIGPKKFCSGRPRPPRHSASRFISTINTNSMAAIPTAMQE